MKIFVLTDDFYNSVAPNCVKFKPNIEEALLSDSEIITIAICGELIVIDSEMTESFPAAVLVRCIVIWTNYLV